MHQFKMVNIIFLKLQPKHLLLVL